MLRHAASLALLLVCCPWASGAPPKMPTGILGEAGRETVVEIESPATGVPVAWRETFSPGDCFIGEMKPLRADTVRLLLIPRKPGYYSVVAWSGKEREDSAVFTLDASKGAPIVIPPDKKDPLPPPKPVPVTTIEGKQFVVVIQDRLRADPNTVTALQSVAFRKWLADGGHEFEIIDTSTAEGAARAAKYKPAFTAFNVPEGTAVMLLQSAEARGTTPRGWVGAMVKLPTSEADLLGVLKTLTGK